MQETRVTPSLASFDEVCGGELPHYPPGSQIPFSQTEHPDEGRMWVVCARSNTRISRNASMPITLAVLNATSSARRIRKESDWRHFAPVGRGCVSGTASSSGVAIVEVIAE